MRRETRAGVILLLILGFAAALRAQSSNPVQYFYDDAGRLTKVVDPSGDVAAYNYDALGNLLSISRTNAVGRFNHGSTQDVTTSVTWSSSNPSVATISYPEGARVTVLVA